eukprot:52468-Eustigmatos_ZCMA.PRE.1
MVKYEKGRIYKLVDNISGLQYIGSTTQPLYKRKSKHLTAFKQWQDGKIRFVTSFKVIGNNDFDIVLLEEVQCETKEQLHARERHFIETLECVNRNIPYRTPEEDQEYHKEYRKANGEALKKQNKEYWKANADVLNAKRAVKVLCECGSEYRKGDIARHNRTKKHKQWAESQM